MRLGLLCVVVMAGLLGCGSSTPSSDTDGSDSSSTTSMLTSNDGENSTAPMTTAETSSSSDGGTTSSSTTTADATSGSTSSGDTGSTGSDGSSSEASSDGSSDGSTTGAVEAPCTAGCMTEFECGVEWESVDACVAWCEANLVEAAMFSDFCEMAWANLSACFGTLSCDEYAEYLSPTMFPYPCANESDALMFECEGQ